MGSLLYTVPDIADSELIFDETETRLILTFFWPDESVFIEQVAVDNLLRCLAQTALIAAIDGSYAMGYVEHLVRTLARPSKGLKQLAKRLARRYFRHWWRHAQQQDLEDVRIYESIRSSVAAQLKPRLFAFKNGVAMKRGVAPFTIHASPEGSIIWC